MATDSKNWDEMLGNDSENFIKMYDDLCFALEDYASDFDSYASLQSLIFLSAVDRIECLHNKKRPRNIIPQKMITTEILNNFFQIFSETTLLFEENKTRARNAYQQMNEINEIFG